MGIGNLIRKAADYADTASAKASEAWETTKAKADSLRGDDAAVYESAINAAGDAIADGGQMNSDIMGIMQALLKNNPY